MTKIVLPLLLAAFATSHSTVFAAPVSELCVLEAEHQEEIDAQFEIKTVDVEETRSLNKNLVRLLNHHIIAQGYTNKPLNLKQIKNLFTEGKEAYNDLYVNFVTSKVSGQKYIEVMSFPGDNPYSHIFNNRGQLVGHSGDGSYSFLVSGKSVYCNP